MAIKRFFVLTLCLMVLASSALAEALPINELELPHLDYNLSDNWCYWADGDEQPADLFIIAPTVDMGRNGNMLGDMGSDKYLSSLQVR